MEFEAQRRLAYLPTSVGWVLAALEVSRKPPFFVEHAGSSDVNACSAERAFFGSAGFIFQTAIVTVLSPLETRISELAEEALPRPDLFVVGVRVTGRDGRRVINVFVDGDAGAPIDDLAEMSRELGFLIDAEDLVRGSYRLNVSSPGVDRPLHLPRQFPKHVGRTLSVRLRGEDATVVGALSHATGEGIVLDTPEGPTTLAYDDFEEARVTLPW